MKMTIDVRKLTIVLTLLPILFLFLPYIILTSSGLSEAGGGIAFLRAPFGHGDVYKTVGVYVLVAHIFCVLNVLLLFFNETYISKYLSIIPPATLIYVGVLLTRIGVPPGYHQKLVTFSLGIGYYGATISTVVGALLILCQKNTILPHKEVEMSKENTEEKRTAKGVAKNFAVDAGTRILRKFVTAAIIFAAAFAYYSLKN